MAALRLASSMSAWKSMADEWNVAMSCIQAEERARINQFVHAEDATLSLIGRLLLRFAAVKMLGLDNNVITFNRTDKGKPYLVDGCGVQLNVSHQGDYVVLAAEWDRKVGVDVMDLNRPRGVTTLSQFFITMNRQFSQAEWQQIKSSSVEQDQLITFYRFWCLKESYIKATGIGLSHGLQRLEFTIDPKSPWQHYTNSMCTTSKLSIDGLVTDDWVFEECFCDDNHCVAIATEGNGCGQAKFIQVTVPELLAGLSSLNPVEDIEWERQKCRPFKC